MVLAKHCHGAVTSLSRIAAGLIQQHQSDHGMISEYNQRIAITLFSAGGADYPFRVPRREYN